MSIIKPMLYSSTTKHGLSPFKNDEKRISNTSVLKYKILHIDSKDINTIPKYNSIYEIKKLNNCFSFISDSFIVTINHPNHSFKENDMIIIKNVSGLTKSFNKFQCFTQDFFIKIFHPNHGITNNTIKYNPIYIKINNIIGTINNNIFNGISTNILNNIHKLILTKNYIDPIDPDFYYINIGVFPNLTLDYTNPFTIEFLSVSSIPTKFLNCNFPLSFYFNQGFHVINNIINNNSYTIKLSTQSSLTINNIGENVNIQKINSITPAYNINDFIINLDTKYNIKAINLISAYIPISQYNIKNSQNNKIKWQIQNDGNITYSCNLDSGYYTPSTLKSEIENKMNSVQRINSLFVNTSLIEYYLNNNFSIEIDDVKNFVSFIAYQQVLLIKPFTIDSVVNGHQLIKINHPSHGFSSGDEIEISNSIDTNGIPESILNNIFSIYVNVPTDINNDTYKIKLPLYNSNTSLSTSGGNIVNIKFKIKFKLFFDEFTCVNILGFRNIGNSLSVYDFNKTITNEMLYKNDNPVDNFQQTILIDNKIFNKPSLNFVDPSFILLTCDIIDNTYKNILNVMSVINLYPNNQSKTYDKFPYYSINLFENLQINLKENLKELSSLRFSFYNTNGNLYDFLNYPFTFSIQITYEDLINNNFVKIS